MYQRPTPSPSLGWCDHFTEFCHHENFKAYKFNEVCHRHNNGHTLLSYWLRGLMLHLRLPFGRCPIQFLFQTLFIKTKIFLGFSEFPQANGGIIPQVKHIYIVHWMKQVCDAQLWLTLDGSSTTNSANKHVTASSYTWTMGAFPVCSLVSFPIVLFENNQLRVLNGRMTIHHWC
jgi:hypothetical protein